MRRSNFLPELSIKAFKQILDLPQADPRFVKVHILNILADRFVKNRQTQVYHFNFKIGVKGQMSIPYLVFTPTDKS